MLIQNYSRDKILDLAFIKYLRNLKSNVVIIYIVVSVFIAIYRLMFMWRISIFQFYADEKDWAEVSESSSFVKHVFTPDAGYFVPLTRAVFWIVYKFSSTPEIVIHLAGCIIVGFCCSSLILFRNINIQIHKKVIIALCLGLYQSFDLLLWMNLNYYLFIVCCFILFNRLAMKIGANSKISNTILFLLMISLGKPQLSLSCCFLVIAIFIIKRFSLKSIRKWYFEIGLVISLVTSILFSRSNSNQLELNITSQNFLHAIAGIFNIPFVLILPFLAIGNSKISGIFNNSSYDLSLNILSITFSMIVYLLLYVKKPKNRKFLHFFSFGLIPIYFSLFIFPNTGWANNYFWNNDCTACMSSRHTFPVFFLAIMILQSYSKNRFLYLLLAQITSLNVIYLFNRKLF